MSSLRRTLSLPRRLGDYKFVHENTRIPSPHSFNIGDAVSTVHRSSDCPALVYTDVDLSSTQHGSLESPIELSFSHMDRLVNKLANSMRFLGIKPGDRVAILATQSFETAISHIATYKSNAIAVPLFIQFGVDALEYRLNSSEAILLVCEPSKLDEVLALVEEGKLPFLRHVIIAPALSCVSMTHAGPLDAMRGSVYQQAFSDAIQVGGTFLHHMSALIDRASDEFTSVVSKADDPSLIIFTSGTTGKPKAAMHAHRVLLGHLPGVEFPQALFPRGSTHESSISDQLWPHDVTNDRFWTPADWSWIGGLLDVFLPSLYHRVPVVACRMRKFDPERAFKLIEKLRVRNMFLPPTALKSMRQVDRIRER